MNITQAGIGSGLQLESIIEAFITAESVPQEIRLQEKEDRFRTELSGVGTFKSSLATFQSVADKLKSVDNFNEQVVTSSSDQFTATTNGFATSGSFEIEVKKLAQATKIQTTSFADSSTTVGAGTLTFNSANGSTFDVAIDAADDLSTIRDKINQSGDNFGVNVTLVNSDAGTFLTYTAANTGLDNVLTVTSGDAALSGLSTAATQTVAADNAEIEIDGNVVTNSTNEFKNNIEDVTIVASKVSSPGVTSTLDISQDTSVANTLITDFVAGFNSLVESMVGLGAPVQGRLAFDADLRTMRGQLSNIAIESVASLSGNSISSLGDIGITFNKEGRMEISPVSIGTLQSGSQKLADAIENDINGVGELFAGTDGIVSQLTTLIDNYNGSDGTLTKRQTALNENLSGIASEYEELETRLRNYEDTLRKRFAFLDSTVAQFNATGDFLTNALALPNTNNSQ